ncbi:MAG: trigger factor [Chlamydiales bacterium]|nr:trigger factor [Chlamydiales bacterium]
MSSNLITRFMDKIEDNSFVVEPKEEAGCRLVVNVHVKPEHSKKCYRKGIKKVNKQISIPGFRKGKAPDATVVSKYGSYVETEWKEIMMQEALQAAFDLTKTYPLSKEVLDKPKMESCSQEEGANFVFSYEHYPKIPEIDFSQISLPKIEKEEVTEEKIDEVVKQIQKSNADFEDVEGRAIKKGDYVDLTIDAIDQDPPASIVKDRRFPIEKDVMAPWMIKALVGKNAGDEFETTSETDPKMSAKEKKEFKPTKVKIQIHSIKKILLPELDDELAKKVGTKSKEDLLERIKQNLEEQAEEERRQKQIDALDEALVKHFKFDLPTSIVEGERQHRIKEQIRRLKLQKLDDEEIKKRETEIEKEVAESVEDNLRLYFLNKQIEKQGKISLSNQELNEELIRQISSNPAYQRQDMDKETSRELISRLSSSLMQKKTKEYALSQVLEKA